MNRFWLVLALLVLPGCDRGPTAPNGIIWNIDNLTAIGGHAVTVLGNPAVIGTPEGSAVVFDGEGDGLILDANPLAGAEIFTVEVIFRPDREGGTEQRFLHFQADEDRRVLVETRLDGDEWFLDTFIKSGDSQRTLLSRDYRHPLGVWYHAALVFDGREMRHYINGSLEMSGLVEYAPVEGGQTSIGCRLNRVYWFKGAIRTIRVSHQALAPAEFLLLD